MPRDLLLQLRGGTAAEWAETDPILAENEPAFETDTGALKVGDGTTPFSELSSITGGVSVPDQETTRQIPYVPVYPNLLNSGFESGSMAGWSTLSVGSPTGGSLTIDTSEMHSGTGCCKVAFSGGTNDLYGVYQANLDLRDVTHIKIYAKSSSTCRLGIAFTDTPEYLDFTLTSALTSSWAQYTIEIPEEKRIEGVNISIGILHSLSGAVTAYLDDITFTSITTGFAYIEDVDEYILDRVAIGFGVPDQSATKQVMYRQITGETGEYAWIPDLDIYIDDEVEDFLQIPVRGSTKQIPYVPISGGAILNGDAEGSSILPWEISTNGCSNESLTQDTAEYHSGTKSFKLSFDASDYTGMGCGFLQDEVDLTGVETIELWLKSGANTGAFRCSLELPFYATFTSVFSSEWTKYEVEVDPEYRVSGSTVKIMFTHNTYDPQTGVIFYIDDIVAVGGSSTERSFEYIEDIDTYFSGTYIQTITSVDNTITRFDGITGEVQGSLVTIDDAGSMNIPPGQLYKINGTALAASDVGAATTATKLDDFATPDDNTDLNANTTNHGLLLKATAPAANVLNVVGIANGETSYANKALFDDTNPAMDGTAAPGTSLRAAHQDHVHPTDTSRAASSHTHTESEITDLQTYSRFRGVSSTTPSDPIAGDLWIDTTSGSVPKMYDGTSWISLT